jgi:hypothetical protein
MTTEKSIAAILAETKEEISQFVSTRIGILKAEIDEKVRSLKRVVPVFLAAATLLVTGWMALTFALIALIHGMFMPSAYAWLWAGLIVAGLYLALGIGIGGLAYHELKATRLTSSRTLTVLKQDQVWIQNEARTA